MKRIILYVLLALTLVACSTPRTIAVTEYRDRVLTDTVTEYRDLVDSTYKAHYVYILGDTVRITDTICQYRLKYVDKVQTQYEYVHDSIPYQVEVVKEVRRRNTYDRATSVGFWFFILIIIMRVAWWGFKTFYLRR